MESCFERHREVIMMKKSMIDIIWYNVLIVPFPRTTARPQHSSVNRIS